MDLLNAERQLIEAAAAATNRHGVWGNWDNVITPGSSPSTSTRFLIAEGTGRKAWDPLTWSEHAYALESELALDVQFFNDSVRVGSATELFSHHGGDAAKARRFAAVRAAAASSSC